jgi:hypothetical protein
MRKQGVAIIEVSWPIDKPGLAVREVTAIDEDGTIYKIEVLKVMQPVTLIVRKKN